MIYAFLRAIAGMALRWYYAALDVEGAERVPARGPLLVVVNHPNALVDALAVGWVLPRRLLITAKATLFANPVAGALLRWVGVVPLRRASDEQALREAGVVAPDAQHALHDPQRNAETFHAVIERLRAGGAVLIFPEGKSHDEPSLAPLRTGAARIALAAVEQGVTALRILPVGLTFERKEAPRSRVFAQVGEPIAVARWLVGNGAPVARDPRHAATELTGEIERRLRAVTLNFASADDASRATALAGSLARLFDEPRAVGDAAPPLAREVEVVRRIAGAERSLAGAGAATRARVDHFLERLAGFERMLTREGLVVEDLGLSTAVAPAARFAVREGAIVAVGAPLAAWGTVNHWIPFHAARAIAMRRVESAADPAMNTIVAGTALVLLFYAAQAAAVDAVAGWRIAAAYVASLPLAAEVNFAFRTRLPRALARARSYLRLRRDPTRHGALRGELAWLREEAVALDAALVAAPTMQTA